MLSTSMVDAAARIKNAGRLVVLTGAGASKESGIPTFRDALTGLWANYNPEELATPEGFLRNPPLVWQWYDWRRQQLQEVQPNKGHYAIVELEGLIDHVAVITQNVDGLHQRAGSKDVVELHGSIERFSCFDHRHLKDPMQKIEFGLTEPPLCSYDNCRSKMRPDVIWFGEALPEEALSRGFVECEKADVILVVGTSGIVQPAASLPFAGKRRGAFLIEVNPEETALTYGCDLFLKGPGGEVLPALIEAVKNLEP
ncbi:MAG: NAD-dependent deacylase [Cyanobacteriota/Melainabacteria group bacterium]|nr:NAD-dependent deacylase [Cyanobacteria bacterium HKST-UBA01]